MTIIVSILAGYILAYSYEKALTILSHGKPLVIAGWRLHHSLYSVLFFVSFLVFQNSIFLGLAIGILIQHTITDGFRFISKERV